MGDLPATGRFSHSENAYCSRDIYLQLEKVYGSVVTLVNIHRCIQRAVFIGCYERATILISS